MSMERHTVAFPGLGIEPFQLDRVAFTIPGIDWPVYWYGILFALAFLLAILYISKRAPVFGLDPDRALDVVLGGGIVRGSLVLVGGDPGVGKSTLLTQVAAHLAKSRKVLYLSAEESCSQVKLRCERLGLNSDKLLLLNETNIDDAESAFLEAEYVIIDSIQAVYTNALSSSAGSVGQVRECASKLMRIAKSKGITFFIVGHVTKEGTLAGPKVLEHIMDAVLYFEGEQHSSCRILRAAKNRFGATNEIGVFEMLDNGLEEVENPSQMLLSGRPDGAPGTCVTCVMEGIRPVLAEIQALLAPAPYGSARRSSNGFDYNRASMLLAVLEKRGGLKVSTCDAYLNIIGGLTLDEPAADLAAVLALASSYLDRPIAPDLAAIGEVGLTGELRVVNNLDQRLSEVRRLGFRRCVIPRRKGKTAEGPEGLQVVEAANIGEAIRAALGK